MNLFDIVLYPVSKENFFEFLYYIDCEVVDYIGCTNVDKYFDIEGVEKQELVNAGLGVKISTPIAVGRGLNGGHFISSSLSHNGVLAIYSNDLGHIIQLTDLENQLQVEIKIGKITQTGFYDDRLVMLTSYKPLRECSVDEIFLRKNVSALKRVGNVKVKSFTDVSLLHSTRVLVFNSTTHIPHEFDVDTKVIRQLDIGVRTYSFASLAGINVGVKGVFTEYGGNRFTYALDNKYSTSFVSECGIGFSICFFIPSSSDPNNIEKGMKIYSDGSFYRNTTEEGYIITPFQFQNVHSIVRLYRDIFLVYDESTCHWCLVKIIVP